MFEAAEKLMNDIWSDIQRMENERIAEAAKENPKKYRDCKVFDKGTGYCYFSTKNGRGSKVRFCYSIQPNVAGYFLVWRETITKKMIKRDKWDSTKSKHDAVRVCRKRYEATNG